MQYIDNIKNASEQATGAVLTGIGATGAAVQFITQWGNMFVMFGNLILVAGGLYLLVHKIRESKRRDRRALDEKD